MPSLRAPGHAIESTVYGALEAFAASLATELAPLNIRLCHFKLGNLELSGIKQRDQLTSGAKIKGTSMRKLHESVFDALQANRPSRTWYVGRGSWTYDAIGSWLPAGVVGWMLGFQNRPREIVEDGSETQLQYEGSDSSIQWEKVEQLA